MDATTGELIAFQDKNQYASRKIMGGVYPVSNDQRPPDGIEQPGWPMPYADITAGGNTVLHRQRRLHRVRGGHGHQRPQRAVHEIVDTCGAVNETSAAGDLDLGFGPNPAGHRLHRTAGPLRR